MKLLIFFLFLFNSILNAQIKLSDIDEFRSFSNPDEKSIIETGTAFVINFLMKIKI